MSRDDQCIADILEAARDALNFAEGLDLNGLEADRRTRAAILYEIVIIGEAANRLSQEFRVQNDHIPWKDIIGMRNILAHQYDQVDAEIVWDVVSFELPELITLLEPLLDA
jgi:uncharacterized protein with HEPN domain